MSTQNDSKSNGTWHVREYGGCFEIWDDGVRRIAEIHFDCSGTEFEKRANANALATAPDGVELARSVLRWYMEGDIPSITMVELARSILARVDGDK